MYSTAWCGVCKRARAYFEEKRITFEEHDVDEDPRARAEYELLNPRRSVPTIKIGDEVVVGFSAAAVERALDAAAKSRIDSPWALPGTRPATNRFAGVTPPSNQ